MEFRGEFETETRAIEDRKREFRVVELTDATIRMEFTAFEASPFTAKYEGKGLKSLLIYLVLAIIYKNIL